MRAAAILSICVICPCLALLVSDASGIEHLCVGTVALPCGKDAEIILLRGISHQWYWPSGNDGKIAEVYANGYGKARQVMNSDDGDWCAMGLQMPDGCRLVIDSQSIILRFDDGSKVESTRILMMDGFKEQVVWDTDKEALVVENGKCPYGRESSYGIYVMYVRFPAGILSDKGDDKARRFKKVPVGVDLVICEEKEVSER